MAWSLCIFVLSGGFYISSRCGRPIYVDSDFAVGFDAGSVIEILVILDIGARINIVIAGINDFITWAGNGDDASSTLGRSAMTFRFQLYGV